VGIRQWLKPLSGSFKNSFISKRLDLQRNYRFRAPQKTIGIRLAMRTDAPVGSFRRIKN
jgi:hypothetical protein